MQTYFESELAKLRKRIAKMLSLASSQVDRSFQVLLSGDMEMMARIQRAKEAKVPITNYGLCISFSQGVIKRVLSPFPAALDALNLEMEKNH